MSSLTPFPTSPQHRILLQDKNLTPLERNTLLLLADQIDPKNHMATVSYEQLRPYLSSSTAGTKAALETVIRAITVLRLTRWIHLAPRRRDPNTGQVQVNQYGVHASPLSFAAVLEADVDYLPLLARSLAHDHPVVRQAAEAVLAEIAHDPDRVMLLSPDLRIRSGEVSQSEAKNPSTVEPKSDTVRTYKILNKEVHTYGTKPDPEKSASVPRLSLPPRPPQPDYQPASLEVANAHLDAICLRFGFKRRRPGEGKGHAPAFA